MQLKGLITEESILKFAEMLLKNRCPVLEYCSLHTVIKVINIDELVSQIESLKWNSSKRLKWVKSQKEAEKDMVTEVFMFQQQQVTSKIVIKHYAHAV